MKKRSISLLLALVMCVTLCLPAFAAECSSIANDTCTTYGGYSATWYAGDYEF